MCEGKFNSFTVAQNERWVLFFITDCNLKFTLQYSANHSYFPNNFFYLEALFPAKLCLINFMTIKFQTQIRQNERAAKSSNHYTNKNQSFGPGPNPWLT